MESFVQALIMAFREGLEAFLIIAILIKFLDKTNNKKLKPSVWQGMSAGVAVSVTIGLALMALSSALGGTDNVAKLWESTASIIAVLLITIKYYILVEYHYMIFQLINYL